MLTRQPGAAVDRQEEIMLRVLSQRVVRIKDLALEFGVSEMTIRRELDSLADAEQVERIHGGARLRQATSEEISYQQRAYANAEAKERIAVAALDLIKDGETVGLDASTTALALARVLPAKRVTAILTGLDAVEAVQGSSIEFFICGGFFNEKARSFVGGLAVQSLEKLHPDKVFFSCNGYTPSDGFTDPNPQEADTKRALLKGGAVKIALIDHSKFGKRSLVSSAEAHDIDIVVTDQEPPKEIRDSFESVDVRIVVANAERGHLN